MARVGGIEIPANKQAWVSLTYVFGIGETLAYKILKEAGVNPQTRIKDVSKTS
jgi:small subunit ribosomal protein S13